MKIVYFGTMDKLAEFMISQAKDKRSSVAALYYDETKELMRELLKQDGVELVSAEFHDPSWDGYNKEYYITFTPDFELYVEKAIGKNGGYLSFENDCLILGADANSAILSKNWHENAETYEAVFDCDDLACDECDFCFSDCKKCDDSDVKFSFDVYANGDHHQYHGEIAFEKFLDLFFS